MAEHTRNNGTDPVTDEELEAYLDGQSPVSEAYRGLGQTEPPEALDRAILREARNEAFVSGDMSGASGFWQRWMRPLGTVVAMGFCLALALQVLYQDTGVSVDERESAAGFVGVPEQEAEPEVVVEELMMLTPSVGDPDLPAAKPPLPGREALTQDSFEMDSSADMATPPTLTEPPLSIQEMVVMNRTREQQLHDAPESVAGDSEEVFVTVRKAEERDTRLADNAVAAWAAGARPAARVWLAGIESLLEYDETGLLEEELEKVSRVYPDDAVEYRGRLRSQLDAATRLLTLRQPADKEADGSRLDEIIVIGADADIADAKVWAAGIDLLIEEGEDALAATEIAKFRQIYPDYGI